MRAAALGCLVACLIGMQGCAREEKIVRYKPFLSGIADAKFNTPPVNPAQGYVDPTADGGEIIRTNPDGSTTLLTRSIRALMAHLENTLDEGEDDLLYEQLISASCKEHWKAAGKDPRQHVLEYLKQNRREIARLFGRMPFAEHSPTVVVRRPEAKVWLVELTGRPAEGLKFTKLHAELERGQWKLLWIN